MTIRKFNPAFSKVVVRLVENDIKKEEVSAGGIIVELHSAKDLELKQQAMGCGYVVAMGPYVGVRRGIAEVVPPCKLGDKILFFKHAGTLLEDMGDGYTHRVIEDLDIEGCYEGEGIEL